MRTKNSFINLIVSWGTQIANTLLRFALRTVFIHILTTEYLGLNGLFSNILNFLSFAELGVGSAIAFSLYKPLAERDETAIAGIMNFFRKTYFIIGIFVLVVGLSFTPFIEYFINDIPDIPYIHLIYALCVVNSGISYFLVYKSTLIIADQRKDIVEKNNFIFKMLLLTGQMGILLLTHNYILYLLVNIIVTLLTNISISMIADKRYRFLSTKKNTQIDPDTLSEIKKNVSATMLHKVGAVIIFGTDNLLISKFFGLEIVGLYSNYHLIIDTLTNFVGQIQASVTASVGNLGITATPEKKLEVFERYLFLVFWLFNFTSICLVALLNPFIHLWIGEQYIIPISVVAVLVFNYFLTGLRSAAATFDNAFGLFWNTRKLPVIESVINLVISIALAKWVGYIGIFLGTTISSLISGTWFEPYVLYKYGFKKSSIGYYRHLMEYFIVTVLSGIFFVFIISVISINGFGGFILKCFIVVFGSNLFLILIYFRSKRMKYIYEIFGQIRMFIKKRFKKGDMYAGD